MTDKRIIRIIAIIEFAIGITTITALFAAPLFTSAHKPSNVFAFVLITSIVSSAIGIGLYRHKEWARAAIIFFSGYIILTKLLIFADLMRFNGEFITVISTDLKNIISIVYHSFIILFFTRIYIKKYFIRY